MKKILLIEDDKKIRRYLEIELESANYKIVSAASGFEGIDKVSEFSPDLILLDLSLPDISGEEVCKKIKEKYNTPIIVVTAKDETFTKVSLLDLGATDYITKPFVIEELLARIRVALRAYTNENIENNSVNSENHNEINNSSKNNNFLEYHSLKIDTIQMKLFVDNIHVPLTKTEYNLISYFILNRELLLTREQIIANVWGYDYLGDDKVVDAYIKILRKKIPENYLKTLRGFGYTLKKD